MFRISSAPDFIIKLEQFSLIGAIRFETENFNTLPLRKLSLFIDKVTNLDKGLIDSISLVDALGIATYYRMSFHNIHPIIESPRILSSDLIREDKDKPMMLLIGDYRFSNKLSLSDAIDAEDTAYSRNDSHMLSYYLIAKACQKGFKEGWETLIHNKDNELMRGQIIAYNQSFKDIGIIEMDLLRPISHKGIVSYSISLVSQGVTAHAVGFHNSNILSVGI